MSKTELRRVEVFGPVASRSLRLATRGKLRLLSQNVASPIPAML